MNKIYTDGTLYFAENKKHPNSFNVCGCQNRMSTNIIYIPTVTNDDLNNEIKVIGISAHAFDGCHAENYELNKNIKYIGEEAFSNSFYFNNDFNWVKENNTYSALYIGDALIRVSPTYPNTTFTVKPGTRLIASEAFAKCNNIEELIMPNSVQYISDENFTNMRRLKTISLPSSIKDVGKLTIPQGVVIRCKQGSTIADILSAAGIDITNIESKLTHFLNETHNKQEQFEYRI